MQFRYLASLAVLCLGVATADPSSTLAQSTSAASIAGLILGPDGNPIFTAELTLSAPDTPPLHTLSAADGSFTFNALASGSYSIKAVAPGFTPLEVSSVPVAIGRTSHLTLRLTLVSSSQSVTVTPASITFDTSQTSSVINIDRDRVEELPIPSRNYLSFVLLAPQVAAANPAILTSGVVQSGGSFSFGGLRPGSNAIYLDDVNDNDEYTGGSRTQLSPEAISDFQIINHGFQAQSGGGAGGAIDVQTRSGTNRLHGDIFTFVQNGSLNATPPLGLNPYKPSESRVRAGVALGGPIQRDRTFFYLAAEQEIAHGQDTNDLAPSTFSAINAAIATYAPLSSLNLQAGFFPTSDQETELSTRIDHHFTSTQSLLLRYAFTNTRNINDAFHLDEQTDRSARGSSFIADNSLNATLSSTLSNTVLNKLSFELAQRRAVQRTGATSIPGILVAGTALFGTPYSGNDRRFETHIESAETLSIQLHKHLLQTGIRFDHVATRAHLPDGAQGLFGFAELHALQTATPDFYTQSFGNFDTKLSEARLAAFAQDHWTVSDTFTLDYGLRYDNNRLPAPLSPSNLNLAPRFGLAWTPWKPTLVRAGFGLFYDRFQLSTIHRIQEFTGIAAFSQTLDDALAANLYRSGQTPRLPITSVAPSIWASKSRLSNPYSEVTSLSIEQALPLQTTLTAEYQFVRGVHLGRSTNTNLAAPVVLTQVNAAALGVSAPTAQQLGTFVFSPTRNNPAYDAVNLFATSAGSSYNGATVTLNRQFQDDLQILAGYTFSKTLDDASYDLEQPQNPYALANENALSLQDQHHRFTLSGLWLLGPDLGDPADAIKNANPGPLMKALTGLEFAPIVSIASGFRSNPITGLDSNREHIFPFAARPVGYPRNSLAAPANIDIDLRVLKMISIKSGHLDVVAESFNILNHRNIATLNTVFGSAASSTPGFGKPIAAGTARRLQFSLDYEF